MTAPMRAPRSASARVVTPWLGSRVIDRVGALTEALRLDVDLGCGSSMRVVVSHPVSYHWMHRAALSAQDGTTMALQHGEVDGPPLSTERPARRRSGAGSSPGAHKSAARLRSPAPPARPAEQPTRRKRTDPCSQHRRNLGKPTPLPKQLVDVPGTSRVKLGVLEKPPDGPAI